MTILTIDQVRARLRKRGLSRKQAQIGSAVACCESPVYGAAVPSSDFSKIGDQNLADDTWGYSYGGFMIRSERAQKGTGGIRDEDQLTKVSFNIDSAVSIFRSGGWDPWTTYTTGMFKALLPEQYPAAPGTYVVVPGDSLSTIADRIGGFTWQDWARVNSLHAEPSPPYPPNFYLLRIGDVLVMPTEKNTA